MELMDFDVVGIGGWSRRELEKRLTGEKISLVIHKGMTWDQILFAAALDHTLKWLKPENIQHVIWPKEKWVEKLREASWRIFPRSYEKLGQKFANLVDQYNEEVPMQDWLLVEHYRHMPVFLKQLGHPKDETEIVRFDLMEVLLRMRDMGDLKSKPSHLQINPTIQVFDNQTGDLTFLKEKGLYLMFASPLNHEVLCEKIVEVEALVLDLMSDDLVLNEAKLQQLVSSQSWGTELLPSEWRQLIHQMQIKGLLL
jgi:hypothetical protein